MIKNNYQRVLGILFVVMTFATIICVIYYWQASHLI